MNKSTEIRQAQADALDEAAAGWAADADADDGSFTHSLVRAWLSNRADAIRAALADPTP